MEKGTKIILGILVLVIILLVVFGAYFLLEERITLFGRAAGGEGKYSLENSYIFTSPVIASAGGQEKIKVSVFLLSPEGKGVANKRIILTATPSLTVSELQPETDEKGQAIFEISSGQPGRYILQASIEGNVLPQSVTVTFN